MRRATAAKKSRKAALRPTEPIEIPAAFKAAIAPFANDPDVTHDRGWGSGNLVAKVKGKIFAMLIKGDFVAKLPRERAVDLVGSGKARYFDPGHGRLMKQWVTVADGRTPWVELAREAHRFVKTAKR